jgi:hypothetical protein
MDNSQNDAGHPEPQAKFEQPKDERVRWWDPPDPQVLAERSAEQVRLIIKAFEDNGLPIGVHRDENGDVDYLYRPDQVLTRDVDAPRVYQALGVGETVYKRSVPRSNDGEVMDRPVSGLTMVQLPDDRRDMQATLDDLDERLGVGVVRPDHLLHVCTTWCNATEPWPYYGTTLETTNQDPDADGRDRLVVVVDTGVVPGVVAAHPWLAGVTGTPEAATVGHYSGHGTFIAGVVRAYAPKADVHVEGVMSVGGSAFESDVVAGLGRALDLAPDVITYSGGARTRANLPLMSFEVFWEQRLRHLKGTVLVAAAGNDGDRGPFWPAAFPWTVSTGALDEDGDERAGYSNHGSWVDVFALGTQVVNAFPAGPYTYREPPRTGQQTDFTTGMAVWSGTSFAAPMVAGLTVARTTWSGESAHDAAGGLLQIGRRDAGVGVGARLRHPWAASRQG